MGILLLGPAGLVLVPPVRGAPVPDLYEARVPLPDAGGQALDEAFARALADVLVKVSGRRTVAGPGLTANAGALVRQYQPVPGGLIRVQFDPTAVRSRLDSAGLPVWGADRPATLVWLDQNPGGAANQFLAEGPAAPEATGSDITAEGPPALRRQLMEVAARRGLPVLLPRAGERPAPEGPGALVSQAAQRGASAVLLGEAQGSSWRWTLLMTGSGEPATWQGDVAAGIQGLGDRLAARHATSIAGIQQLRLRVAGVRSFESFARLQQSLESLEELEGIAIRNVRGDVVDFVLTVRGDADRLQGLLARQGLLTPAAAEGNDSALLVYRLTAESP